MNKLDLVKIKSNGHNGFVTRIIGTKYLVYDCDAKCNRWFGYDDVEFVAGLNTILSLFEQALVK